MTLRAIIPAAVSIAMLTGVTGVTSLSAGRLGAASQQSGTVVGQVVDATTDRPIPDTRVLLRPVVASPMPATSRGEISVLTSATGTFSIPDVRPGEYTLRAMKPGFVGGLLGQHSPTGTLVHLKLGSAETRQVRLLLWKGTVLSGRIELPTGAPAASYVAHLIRLTGTQPTFVRAVVANEGGEYVMPDLFPGKYWLAISERQVWRFPTTAFPRPVATPLVFYPNASLPTEAAPVSLFPAEDKRVDIRIPTARGHFQVSGQLIGACVRESLPSVRLVAGADRADGLTAPIEFAATSVRSDGTFVFEQVPVGSYVIRGLCAAPAARSSGPVHTPLGFLTSGEKVSAGHAAGAAYWFSQPVRVSAGNVEGLSVPLQPGLRVRGTVSVSPGSTVNISGLADTPVSAFPVDGWNLDGLPPGSVRKDGTFVGPALPPGRFHVGPYLDGAYVEKVSIGGRDVTYEGLDVGSSDVSGVTVTVSSRRTPVSGIIVDEKSQPRADATIYVFPTDRRRWMPLTMATFRSDATANYSFELGTGDYFVAAVVGDPVGSWRDESFLSPLIARARRLTVRSKEVRSLTLIVQTFRESR